MASQKIHQDARESAISRYRSRGPCSVSDLAFVSFLVPVVLEAEVHAATKAIAVVLADPELRGHAVELRDHVVELHGHAVELRRLDGDAADELRATRQLREKKLSRCRSSEPNGRGSHPTIFYEDRLW